jgi:hypothetical protein
MRSKNRRDVDLRAEVERSRELEEMLSWIETPRLVSVDFVVHCGPNAEAGSRLEVCYALSTPDMHMVVRTWKESIRDALILWACADEDGEAQITGLARTLGADTEAVRAEVKAQIAERLPESIEEIHDEALRMAAVNGETDFTTALLARLLTAHPEVTDEAVQAVLDHRCVATVMRSRPRTGANHAATSSELYAGARAMGTRRGRRPGL